MASEKMKYTAKVKQSQLVCGAAINPKGGELSADQVKAIVANPYGKDLIKRGYLSIEGVKPEDLDKPEKPAAKKPAAPPAHNPTGSPAAASASLSAAAAPVKEGAKT